MDDEDAAAETAMNNINEMLRQCRRHLQNMNREAQEHGRGMTDGRREAMVWDMNAALMKLSIRVSKLMEPYPELEAVVCHSLQSCRSYLDSILSHLSGYSDLPVIRADTRDAGTQTATRCATRDGVAQTALSLWEAAQPEPPASHLVATVRHTDHLRTPPPPEVDEDQILAQQLQEAQDYDDETLWAISLQQAADEQMLAEEPVMPVAAAAPFVPFVPAAPTVAAYAPDVIIIDDEDDAMPGIDQEAVSIMELEDAEHVPPEENAMASPTAEQSSESPMVQVESPIWAPWVGISTEAVAEFAAIDAQVPAPEREDSPERSDGRGNHRPPGRQYAFGADSQFDSDYERDDFGDSGRDWAPYSARYTQPAASEVTTENWDEPDEPPVVRPSRSSSQPRPERRATPRAERFVGRASGGNRRQGDRRDQPEFNRGRRPAETASSQASRSDRGSRSRWQMYVGRHPSIVFQANGMPRCWYCQAGHPLCGCPKFVELTRANRYKAIETYDLCHNCLSFDHWTRDCTSRDGCRCDIHKCQCGDRHAHNSLLCGGKRARW